MSRFSKFAWFVLVFNLFVILWGGLVSASGSGDGCGDSWPLCADPALREATSLETFIELFHRGTSGVALLFVVGMWLWSRRLFAADDVVRRAAWWSTLFIFGEAAIGAVLVLLGLVAENESMARAIVQPLHLVNTFLLLAALGLVAWWSAGYSARPARPKLTVTSNPHTLRWLMIVLGGFILLGAFGTIASLASTIFPSESFLDGVQNDFARDAHYLIRLRIWHPILATLLGVCLLYVGSQWRGHSAMSDRLVEGVWLLFSLQFGLGALNAVLLTPLWLQLVHLLVSDLLWLGLVWLGATVVGETVREREGDAEIERLRDWRLGIGD